MLNCCLSNLLLLAAIGCVYSTEFAAPLWGTTTAELTVVNSSCVQLVWSEPEIPNGVVNGYQFECTDQSIGSLSALPTEEILICGYFAYTRVSCEITAWNDHDASDKLTAAVYTSCGEPTLPRSFRFSSPSKVTFDGRIRWRFYLYWTYPEKLGCGSITSYELRYTSGSNSSTVKDLGTSRNHYMYVNSGEEVVVSVRARNNGWFYSDYVSLTLTSAKLEPDWGSTAAVSETLNSSCVIVSWNEPEFPHDVITGYQIKCTGSSTWTPLPVSQLAYTTCGYEPYDAVDCQIKAASSQGVSASLSNPTARTSCGVPTPPRQLYLSPYSASTNDGRLRNRYRAGWQAPASVRCASVNVYELRFPSNSSSTMSTSSTSWYYLYADGNVEVTLWVRAINSGGFYSQPSTLTITTGSISPQWGSSTAVLTAESSSCATLSWSEPEYPNGYVFSYQHKCSGSSTWTTVTTNTSSVQVCGFTGYTTISCSIAAINYQGIGNSITSSSTRTYCSEPTPPRSVTFTASTVSTRNGRNTQAYTIRWSAPLYSRCERIGKYQTRFPADSGSTIFSTSTSKTIYTFGDEELSIWITAVNDAGNVSEPVIATYYVPPFRPQWGSAALDLQPYNSSCVQLSWDSPEFPGEEIIGYEHKCTAKSDWTKIDGTKLSAVACGYVGYQDVSCDMRAVSSRGQGDEKSSPTAKTLCSASTEPRSINFGYPSVITNNDYKILRYTVTWQAPYTLHCDSISWYETRFPTPTSDIVVTSTNSRTVYTEGNTRVVFWVRAVNSAGNVSQPITLPLTSGDVKPQWGSVAATLNVSEKAGCVVLSWKFPQFPGGDITAYKHKCTYPKHYWTQVGATRLSAEICGYSSYTNVQCEVLAHNDAGDGDVIESNAIRTSCTASTVPRSIDFDSQSTEVDKGRVRLRYIIRWQAPTTVNCGSISHYEMRFPTSTSPIITTTSTVTTVYTDGNELVTFWVRAVNNAGLTSEPEIKTITTDIIAPQLAPSSLTLQTTNNVDCILVSWQPPEYLNGPITSYEHKCTGSSTWTGVSPTIDRVEVCGVTGLEVVQCQVLAKNSGGSSDIATMEILPKCAAPKLPDDLTQFIVAETYTLENSTEERIRLKLEIPEEYLSINCNSLDTLEYRLTPDSAYTANGEYIYNVSVETQLNINVRAVNNGGWESDVAVAVRTDKLIPTLSQCDEPPIVDNAELIGDSNVRLLGLVVAYSCKKGFVKTQGESLTCQLVDDAAAWVGEETVCDQSESSGIQGNLVYIVGLGVPLALALLALLIVACTCTCKVSRRKKKEDANAPASSNVVINMGNISTSLTTNEKFDNPAYAKDPQDEKLSDSPTQPATSKPMSLPPLTKERSSLPQANPAEREAPHSVSNQYYTTPVTTPDHLYAGPVPQVPDSQRPNILQSQQDVYLKGQGQSADGYLTPEAKLPDGYIDIVEEEADGGYETIPTDN